MKSLSRQRAQSEVLTIKYQVCELHTPHGKSSSLAFYISTLKSPAPLCALCVLCGLFGLLNPFSPYAK